MDMAIEMMKEALKWGFLLLSAAFVLYGEYLMFKTHCY